MKTSTESRQKMRETIARERKLEFNLGNHHVLDMLDVVLDDLDEVLGEAAMRPPCSGKCHEVPAPGAEAASSHG